MSTIIPQFLQRGWKELTKGLKWTCKTWQQDQARLMKRYCEAKQTHWPLQILRKTFPHRSSASEIFCHSLGLKTHTHSHWDPARIGLLILSFIHIPKDNIQCFYSLNTFARAWIHEKLIYLFKALPILLNMSQNKACTFNTHVYINKYNIVVLLALT